MLNPSTMLGWNRPVGIEVPYVNDVKMIQNDMKTISWPMGRYTPGKLPALIW
jgi:hypothetical protein